MSSRTRDRVIGLASVLLALWGVLIGAPPLRAEEPIRFGVYLNPPFSYPDYNGQPGGFIVDLMKYIASRENWPLEFVPCTWKACNEQLVSGELNMLSPMALSDARERKLDFNRESLYVNWGQIVTAKGADELESPLDLADKSIIALSGDVHFADLKMLAEHYDIDVRFLEVDSYDDVLAWVAHGPVDAGLVSRSLDLGLYPQYDLEKSAVIFNPAEIRIVLSPRNGQLQNALRAQRLDQHLTLLKGNKNSSYYQLQSLWFGSEAREGLAEWVLWLLLVVATISLLLAFGVLLLRRQVRRQTRHIRQISDRFSAFMEHFPGIAYMKRADGRYLFVNPVWERTKDLASAEVVGRRPQDIWPAKQPSTHVPEELEAIEQRREVESVETSPWDDSLRYWRLIRFPIDEGAGQVMVGGIGLDVTSLRQTEEKLHRLNRQLQLLLESAGDGIFGLDGLGRCTFINQAAMDLLGYTRDEVIGKNMHDLVCHSYGDGKDFPEEASPIYRAAREGVDGGVVEQQVFWHASGTCFPVAYSVRPLDEGSPRPGAVVVFRRDGVDAERVSRSVERIRT